MQTETYKGFVIRPDSASDRHVVDDIYERDDYAVREIIARELHERPLPKPPLAIDVGAHIGTFCRRWHEEVPEGVVVAIEQDEQNVRLLRHNAPFAAIVHGVFVGDGAGREGEYQLHHLLQRAPVEALPAVLKLDVEGFEFDVLQHASPDLLDRFLYIVGEFHGGEMSGLGSGKGSSAKYKGAPGGTMHFFEMVRRRLPGFLAYACLEMGHFLLRNYSWWHRHGRQA